MKTKNRSFFFSADLFEFLLFVDSSSHCASLTSSHMLFFLIYICSWIFLSSINLLFMFFLYLNPDLVDAIFWTSRLEMKSYKTCKSVKEQKTVSLFLCISLWIFAFFFFDSWSHYVSLTSWHLLSFWGLCVFLNFLVINELSITLVTTRFQVFEGNSWSCSIFLILFFYFYGDFLFVLCSSSTFTHIYSF